MANELALTAITRSSFSFNSVRSDFEGWLKDAGSSEVTIRSYVAAIQKWLKVLALNPGVRPVVMWQRSQLSASTKRVIGYACRRYEMFASEVMGERIDLGIPSRLPVASRPNPKPISDKHLRELSIAAKKLFPLETSFSFRAWLHFLNETGCRRTESEIDWSCVRLVAPQCCGAREDRGARTASKSQDDSNPAIFISPQEIGSMDGMSVAKVERRSSILALQKSCPEDRSAGSSASLAASSTTDKAVQFNARKQSSPRAFFCWPIESISLQYYYRVSLEEKRNLLTVK